MIKIGTTDGKALVSLTGSEYTGLSGSTIANTPDGTSVSLSPLQAKIALVDAKQAELLELKTQCQDVIAKLNSIGI
jgi:hypothetical protein